MQQQQHVDLTSVDPTDRVSLLQNRRRRYRIVIYTGRKYCRARDLGRLLACLGRQGSDLLKDSTISRASSYREITTANTVHNQAIVKCICLLDWTVAFRCTLLLLCLLQRQVGKRTTDDGTAAAGLTWPTKPVR